MTAPETIGKSVRICIADEFGTFRELGEPSYAPIVVADGPVLEIGPVWVGIDLASGPDFHAEPEVPKPRFLSARNSRRLARRGLVRP